MSTCTLKRVCARLLAATILVVPFVAGDARELPRGGTPPAGAARGTMQERWREDLQAMVAGLRAHHPNPFHGISETEFNAAAAMLDARLDTLSVNEINLELVGLAASISRNGRDGHTWFIPSPIHLLPLQLYLFGDGVFVVDARPPYEGLVGRQVMGIGDHPIEDALAVSNPYVSRDNEWTVAWQMPTVLIIPEFSESFGFIADQDRVPLRLRDSNGQIETVTLAPIGVPEYQAWREFPTTKLPQTRDELYLSDSYDPFWFRFLADSSTLYIRYNQVLRVNDSGQTMTKFVKKVKKQLKKRTVERLVIDLRQNNGGNNTTYEPLLAALESDPTINQRGRLFAIVDRGVFSAAANFVTDLERRTDVLLVGEPTGGSPNHYGDSVPVVLPNFGGVLLVSTRFHQRSDPDDPRLSIAPDIAVELSAADYFAGRDPALDAILALSVE